MTHDELLDYLREHEEYWTSLRAQRWAKLPAFNALRAVVALHKPWKSYCSYCLNIEGGYMLYPCTEIQTITKELK